MTDKKATTEAPEQGQLQATGYHRVGPVRKGNQNLDRNGHGSFTSCEISVSFWHFGPQKHTAGEGQEKNGEKRKTI